MKASVRLLVTLITGAGGRRARSKRPGVCTSRVPLLIQAALSPTDEPTVSALSDGGGCFRAIFNPGSSPLVADPLIIACVIHALLRRRLCNVRRDLCRPLSAGDRRDGTRDPLNSLQRKYTPRHPLVSSAPTLLFRTQGGFMELVMETRLTETLCPVE